MGYTGFRVVIFPSLLKFLAFPRVGYRISYLSNEDLGARRAVPFLSILLRPVSSSARLQYFLPNLTTIR